MKKRLHRWSMMGAGIALMAGLCGTSARAQIVHIDYTSKKKGVVISVTPLNPQARVAVVQDIEKGDVYISLPTPMPVSDGDDVEFRQVGNGHCNIVRIISPGNGGDDDDDDDGGD